MHPQLSEALLHERVREFHRDAEISRLAKLARRARRSHRVTAAVTTHPVATLGVTAQSEVPVEQTGVPAPCRAA